MLQRLGSLIAAMNINSGMIQLLLLIEHLFLSDFALMANACCICDRAPDLRCGVKQAKAHPIYFPVHF